MRWRARRHAAPPIVVLICEGVITHYLCGPLQKRGSRAECDCPTIRNGPSPVSSRWRGSAKTLRGTCTGWEFAAAGGQVPRRRGGGACVVWRLRLLRSRAAARASVRLGLIDGVEECGVQGATAAFVLWPLPVRRSTRWWPRLPQRSLRTPTAGMRPRLHSSPGSRLTDFCFGDVAVPRRRRRRTIARPRLRSSGRYRSHRRSRSNAATIWTPIVMLRVSAIGSR